MPNRNEDGRCRDCGRYICKTIHLPSPSYGSHRDWGPLESIVVSQSDADFLDGWVSEEDLDGVFGMSASYDPFSDSVIGDR